MFRRDFIQRLTVGGASGLAAAGAIGAAETQVTYQIDGFSCVTCAVGLEVMLRQQPGITRADASYPARQVVIGYDASLTNEETIKQFISSTGFTIRD